MEPTEPCPCPCESGLSYADCCQKAHQGKEVRTCEQLMRSRYSAYVLGLADYLVETTHPSSRTSGLKADVLSSLENQQWQGLSVITIQSGGQKDKKGRVEFVARYRVKGGQQKELHELSRFVRYAGKWVYLDGTLY